MAFWFSMLRPTGGSLEQIHLFLNIVSEGMTTPINIVMLMKDKRKDEDLP